MDYKRLAAFASVVCTAGWLCGTPARAALMAYTGFAAPPGAIGSNLAAWGAGGNAADASGVGWTNGFQYSSSYGNGILIAANSLAYGSQLTAGCSAISTATDGGSYYRDFSAGAHQAWLDAASTNGEVWLSFLVSAKTNTSVSGTSGAMGLVLRADSGFNNLVLGAAAYSGTTWGYSDGSVYGSGQLSGVTRGTNVVKFTLRFTYSATGAIVRGYVGTGGDPTVLPAAFSSNSLSIKPTFKGIALTSSAANNYQWDEIAAGNGYGDVSFAATNIPPAIVSGPIGGAVSAGGFYTFSVAASGAAPLAYQWYCNGNPVSGATNSALALNGLTPAQQGNYYVSVTNRFGATNSPAAQLTLLQFAPVSTNLAGVAGLIQRLLPSYTNNFLLQSIPADSGRDTFEIESIGNQIALRGNNGIAAAMALNYYLKNFCHCDVSWNGNQLALPYPLPAVSPGLHIASPHKYRFAYNPCTFGYTMAWWQWADYEREIDYLALNGINVAQVVPGTEAVFQSVLRDQFGYGNADVAAWLCLPSHLPWMLMGNMYGFGGPVPQSVINGRCALGQQICQRMRDLGIEPMMQGCFGMVPPDFSTRYPSASVIPQGGWGVFTEPNLLNMTDPLFPRLATNMYLSETNLFGPVRFFSADPFHEGGSTSGITLAAAGAAIQNAMFTVATNAVWVIEAWSGQPNETMLGGTVRSQVLVLDLQCEDSEQWRSTANFSGTPWLWCAIQNYGGNSGLYGKLWALAQRPVAALTDPNRGNYSGIGFAPEGSQTIPAAYDMLFENAWRTNAPDLHQWACDYARHRYGESLPGTDQAWAVLADTVYASQRSDIQGPHNSAMDARPSLNAGILARTWSTTTIPYDPVRLASAWQSLESCAGDPGLQQADSFRFDLADVTRQVLCDLVTRNQQMLGLAYTNGNAAAVHLYGDRILSLIADSETLAATRQEWLLGKWIAEARSWGSTAGEQDLCEYNARLLLTTWANSTSSLNDYANREWSGLIGGFYLPRWQQFMTNLYSAVDNSQAFNQAAAQSQIAAWELQWITQHQTYPTNTAGDTLVVVSNLFTKYYAQAASAFDRTNYPVTTTWSSGICSITPVIWTNSVTGLLSGAGDYAVNFQYTGGNNALVVASASLLQGGTNLSTDAHYGWTGSASYLNNYYFTLTNAATPTALSIVAASQAGTGSAGNITFQKCRAQNVGGNWIPANCATAPTVWTWDVSSLVTNAGDYLVTFQFTSGVNLLNVDRAWFAQNNGALDVDAHPGQVFTNSANNTYWLRIRSLAPGIPLLLKTAIFTAGGTNSAGTISLRQVAALPPVPQTFASWSAAWNLGLTNFSTNVPAPYVTSYFNGSNPAAPGALGTPAIKLQNSGETISAVFSFDCQPSLVGINAWLETSVDLLNWSALGGQLNFLGQTNLSNGQIQMNYTTTLPVSTDTCRFFRLKATLE